MNNQRAQQILRALVQGMHPLTGEPVVNDSVLQDADVLRALLAGITALDIVQHRAARRAQLPKNVGQRWTEAETVAIRQEFERGESLETIARAHGRSVRAVTHRL